MVVSTTPGQQEPIPDLSVCEREPIHTPSSIEPNGALLAFAEPDLRVLQVSSNAIAVLGVKAEVLIGMTLPEVFDESSTAALRSKIDSDSIDENHRYFNGVRVRNSRVPFDALVHRHDGVLIVELEPAFDPTGSAHDLYADLTDALADLEGGQSLVELCLRITRHIRRTTGFDRIMVYQFLEDGTGAVIAEDKREDLIPYLGLRYPASDIPAQARRLYLLNTLRLKADVNAPRAPLTPAINPATGRPLDMTYCILRAMSPVHDEYLRNMGVSASMSISIVKDGELWGLIACHHGSAKIVPHPIRITCEVLARVFSARIAAAERRDSAEYAESIRAYRERLTRELRGRPDPVGALAVEGERLASIISAQGFAICIGREIVLAGLTPPVEDVKSLQSWLNETQSDYLFATDRLSEHFAAGERMRDPASGLLSARIAAGAPDFVMWFRPSVVRVIEWAGNPSKPVEETEAGKRISPRRSFELWKETVRTHSAPWQSHEQEFALDLRQIVAEALLVQLNLELERSNIELDAFAYAASHDLQEPIRTIRSYSQLLARRTAAVLDDPTRELIKVIESGAERMGNLIAALLAYGQVGGTKGRERKPVNLEDVLRWVIMNLNESLRASGAEITHDPLPTITSDPDQMIQLLQNLVLNSIKYRRPDAPPVIHMAAQLRERTWHFAVRDNGQGFQKDEAEFIFGAFKRLHGREIPGTGIGLALCRRIVEYHGGTIWAESQGKDMGATFFFTLPQS